MQPVDRVRRLLDGDPHEHRVGLAAGETHDVVEVAIDRIVVDANIVLAPDARPAHVAGADVQRATDLAVFLEYCDGRAGLGRDDRARDAGSARADDDHVHHATTLEQQGPAGKSKGDSPANIR